MDSCQSGSLQSSSGNEEEYNSRAALAFNQQPHFPFANNLQMSNFNTPWSVSRSDQNPTTHSFVPQQIQPENNHSNVTLLQQGNSTEKQAAARNPKKRSRASRRAPTTVLNTDTSNFRAMVQQFTGIPSTPFHDDNNNMNINKRSRLCDLFGAATSNGGSAYSPPYVLRPFAHKPMPSPLASSSFNNNNSLDQEARKFSSNVFDVQNPISVNSIMFQNNPSFPISNHQLQSGSSSSFGSYMMIPTSNEVHFYNSSFDKMGVLNDHQFGLISHGNGNVNGLPNLISSERKDGQQKEADDHGNMFPVNNRESTVNR